MTKDIMKINDYVQWTENTCASLETTKLDTIHMLFGISTEIGELTDVFKKHMAYNREIDWVNVEEEIGDLMFYIASFARIVGINLEKITKVSKKLAGFDTNELLFKMTFDVGDLMWIFENHVFHDKKIEDWIPVTENIGDLMACIIAFCGENELDFQQIILTNVKKLETRYPEKFTSYHANNRDLEKERKILENK